MSDKKMMVEDLMKEKLKVSKLDRKATLDTYGLDSLDVMEFLLEVEDKYNVKFDSDDIRCLHSIGELLDLIQAKVK